jgi:hypothetical protein
MEAQFWNFARNNLTRLADGLYVSTSLILPDKPIIRASLELEMKYICLENFDDKFFFKNIPQIIERIFEVFELKSDGVIIEMPKKSETRDVYLDRDDYLRSKGLTFRVRENKINYSVATVKFPAEKLEKSEVFARPELEYRFFGSIEDLFVGKVILEEAQFSKFITHNLFNISDFSEMNDKTVLLSSRTKSKVKVNGRKLLEFSYDVVRISDPDIAEKELFREIEVEVSPNIGRERALEILEVMSNDLQNNFPVVVNRYNKIDLSKRFK